MYVQRFEANRKGRDFAVGDVHGHFSRLQRHLDTVGFDPLRDRLFSVGDLVDRGPESLEADEWLAKPWFHAIRGNHEQMTIDAFYLGEARQHMTNGGTWFYGITSIERASYASLMADLPWVIEVETPAGLVGIVHAECIHADWDDFLGMLQAGGALADSVQQTALWSRKRIRSGNTQPVGGVRAVVVGHTQVAQTEVLGNVYHIDTGGWRNGHFTLLELATLQSYAGENYAPYTRQP